jgi:hypothetical protein
LLFIRSTLSHEKHFSPIPSALLHLQRTLVKAYKVVAARRIEGSAERKPRIDLFFLYFFNNNWWLLNFLFFLKLILFY